MEKMTADLEMWKLFLLHKSFFEPQLLVRLTDGSFVRSGDNAMVFCQDRELLSGFAGLLVNLANELKISVGVVDGSKPLNQCAFVESAAGGLAVKPSIRDCRLLLISELPSGMSDGEVHCVQVMLKSRFCFRESTIILSANHPMLWHDFELLGAKTAPLMVTTQMGLVVRRCLGVRFVVQTTQFESAACKVSGIVPCRYAVPPDLENKFGFLPQPGRDWHVALLGTQLPYGSVEDEEEG